MMKKIMHNVLLTITIISYYATAMENPKTHLLVIPGQNGCGGENVELVLPYFKNNQHLIHHVETPLSSPDFGQSRCQSFVKERIDWLKTNHRLHDYDHLILHGSSQGTATTINYTAHNPHNIKAIILESILLTGNSAIFHTVDNVILPDEYNLPEVSYYSLPYTAKSVYPCYSPTGEQPINNIDKLPTDLLTIILHDSKDFQLSCKDAQALYAYLTIIRKNKKVYLFAQESMHGKHINLLTKENKKEIAAINTILKLYNLLPFDPQENINMIVNVKDYQPEPQQEWLDHFNKIFNKEQNLKIVDTALKTTTAGAITYTASKSCTIQ